MWPLEFSHFEYHILNEDNFHRFCFVQCQRIKACASSCFLYDDLLIKEKRKKKRNDDEYTTHDNASVHISRAFAYNWMVCAKISNKYEVYFLCVDDTCRLRFHSNSRLVARHTNALSLSPNIVDILLNTSMSCGGLHTDSDASQDEKKKLEFSWHSWWRIAWIHLWAIWSENMRHT